LKVKTSSFNSFIRTKRGFIGNGDILQELSAMFSSQNASADNVFLCSGYNYDLHSAGRYSLCYFTPTIDFAARQSNDKKAE
jgi:hypothetical protein